MGFTRKLLVSTAALTAMVAPSVASAAPSYGEASVSVLVTGLQGSVGSTVGPDGALYVTESAVGRITRVDPKDRGHHDVRERLAEDDPGRRLGRRGRRRVPRPHRLRAGDLGRPLVGGQDVAGIYRVDGPNRVTVVADIGQFALDNPPQTAFVNPSGLQYAMEAYRGGFLVTDGHHNRVYRVKLDGRVSELIAFGNIVPTGLAVRGRTIYMAEAGAVPHLPEDGKVVKFGPRSSTARPVASGAPLVVDVEFGPGHRLYALSQGHFTPGSPEGAPADPNTGALVRVNRNGTMTPVAANLDRPASLEFIRGTAYVVTLGGDILKIDKCA